MQAKQFINRDRPYLVGLPNNQGFLVTQQYGKVGEREDFYGGFQNMDVVPVRSLTPDEIQELGPLAYLSDVTNIIPWPNSKVTDLDPGR